MKKTKPQFKCIKTVRYSGWINDYYEYDDYPNLRTHCHKRFSTLNEAKQALTHKEDEYRSLYKIRGRRTRKALPNAWDDHPTFIYDVLKSWKFNSKRKKQWYKEKCDNKGEQ